MKRFAAADPAAPQVAVVIATCRRPGLLRRCLQALLRQQGLVHDWEIVVVDDGPCAETETLVRTLAEGGGTRPRLRYARAEGTRGPAGARNTGWRSTRAPVIAFTDDDTVPAPDWLAEGLRALGGGLVAAGGRVVVPVHGAPTDHARMTQGLERAEFVTANAFVRRNALLGVGGFDARFTRAWREDSDLQFALLERYGGVGRAERAVVVHPVRPVRWGISMAQQANVYFDALLYAKHPALFRSRIRRRPPWLYALVVGAGLAALGTALAGQGAWAGAFAALALAGCLVFALRRLRGASHAPGHVAEMLVTSLAIPFLACYWRLRGAWRFRTLFP